MVSRLSKSESRPAPKRTPQEWADRGNRVLLGIEATTKGEFQTPRHDVHWVVRDGRCVIEWK